MLCMTGIEFVLYLLDSRFMGMKCVSIYKCMYAQEGERTVENVSIFTQRNDESTDFIYKNTYINVLKNDINASFMHVLFALYITRSIQNVLTNR